MKAVFNFTTVEDKTFLESLQNRAFCYGDGLFETMLLENGTIRFLADHFHRLQAGVHALGMRLPENLTPSYLQESSLQLAEDCGLGMNARVRLQVWRKSGGLYTPTCSESDFICTISPLIPPIVGIKEKVIFYTEVKLSYSAVSSYKTCSALPYVMAGIARQAAQADDAILLDVRGFVAECIASNLFWLKDNVLYTPSLEAGCVAGIMRTHIFREAAKISLQVCEGLYTPSQLLQAEAVFCCNVGGIQLVSSIHGTIFDTQTPIHSWLCSLVTSPMTFSQ